jgi:hypothetical protein
MSTIKVAGVILLALALGSGHAHAQAFYKFIFRGTAYQTNATGNVAAIPITEQTLLEDRARAGGITNLSSLAIAYHVNGDAKGDTVEIVDLTSRTVLALQFGLWFGSDPKLERSAILNADQTEARRVDYIYTLQRSTYTSPSSHSMGATFVTKRMLKDAEGNTHFTAEGPIHWIVNPQNGYGTTVCTGTFTTGKQLF